MRIARARSLYTKTAYMALAGYVFVRFRISRECVCPWELCTQRRGVAALINWTWFGGATSLISEMGYVCDGGWSPHFSD